MELLNDKLKSTLDAIGLPVSDGLYSGEEKTYITFNYNAVKSGFADDAPEYVIYLIQVHLFAPAGENLAAIRRQIKKKLYEAGFDYPDELDASDEKGQHKVFEIEEIEELNREET